MRGAGIDHASGGIFNHRYRLFGRIIGQAQHRQINGIQQALSLAQIFAFVRGNADDVDIVALT